MTNGFVELVDTASLDRFIAESNHDPAIIFKHSNSCGISASAYTEMTRVRQRVGIITVQKARALSEEVVKRFGVEHESPQVLIVKDGKVTWTASHGRVRAEAVEKAAGSNHHTE